MRRTSGKQVGIIYSVCSFTEAETDGVLETIFRKTGTGPHTRTLETVNIEEPLRQYGFNYKAGEHGVYLLPDDRLNNDMFYISLLKG